jgi:hypothetical protein
MKNLLKCLFPKIYCHEWEYKESFINDLYLYPTNKVSLNALNSFDKKVMSFSDKNLVEKIRSYNNEIFNLISEFDLDYLFVSYTSSDSLFYRFKVFNSSFEFKWNIFINNDKEENSTLIIYKNSNKKHSYYGSISELYTTVNDTLNEVSEEAILQSEI